MILSQEDVRRAVTLEHSLQRQFFPESFVSEVLRYGADVGSQLQGFTTVGRCMDVARQKIQEVEEKGGSFRSGSVFFARQMHDGMGRFQRHWHAPEGGLWLCLVVANTFLDRYLHLLPLAVGAACCATARQCGAQAQVKWVNDVHVCGQKLAGVLMETVRAKISGEQFILVGIGMNGNNTDFPKELTGQATSLSESCGEAVNLRETMALLLAKLRWFVGLVFFQEWLDLRGEPLDTMATSVLSAWKTLSDTVGRQVAYGFDVVTEPRYTGQVLDIDNSGGIVLQLEDGSIITETGGEIVYL